MKNNIYKNFLKAHDNWKTIMVILNNGEKKNN
jgi:hypothetical protein